MKLELKHLAAYLPYGLQCEVIDMGIKKTLTLNGLYEDCSCVFYDSIESHIGYESVKPVLRNLSDLTKEIEYNGEMFVPCLEIDKLFDVDFSNELSYCIAREDDGIVHIDVMKSYDIAQKLLDWKFDLYSLIENNLAVDIKTIEK